MAQLKAAYWGGAFWSEADLSTAILRGAIMRGAILSGADLRGADLSEADLSAAILRGADLSEANLSEAVLDTGETLDEYVKDVLPALLTAGGKPLADIANSQHWDCHDWTNCPMAAAFGVSTESAIPALYRPRARQFIQLFDAKLIPLEVVGKGFNEANL